MNLRQIIPLFALAAFGSLWADEPADSTKEKVDSVGNFRFSDVKTVKSTSVKDQNKSGTCWCFSTMSFLEDEILRQGGDSLDLSEMFAVRKCYSDKADRYMRMYGQANFGAGGSDKDVPYVWKRYGIVPDSIYTGLLYGEDKHVHAELDAVLRAYLDAVKAKPNRRLSTAWRRGYEAILDAYLGPEPTEFTVNGRKYTPQSYAASLPLNIDDYISLTSFTHHPFYEAFPIEVPDNWLWATSMNLPLDDLKAVIDNAVENGYPIAWGADVSEPGFKWNKGFAVMAKEKKESEMEGTELSRWVKLSDKERRELQEDVHYPVTEIEVTQQSRQDMFDRQETTDDHGMEIVGYATDQDGKRYYKVRNSWDNNQVYGGYFYVSEPYLLAKTMDILVHRDAVPKAIAKKFK